MNAATALDSDSTATVSAPPVESGRPDVGLLVGTDCGHRALGVALQKAIASGGKVCVIRYVDPTGIRSPGALIRRSAVARSQLAHIVSKRIAGNTGPRVIERLHVGTLESLLNGLGQSIGTVVLESPEDPVTREIVALCPVPVCVVDETGAVTTHDGVGGVAGGQG